MSDMDNLPGLYHDGMTGVTMGTLTRAGFYTLQKQLLGVAMGALKDGPSPDADCLIGIIGVMDGDKFDIPPEHAMAHLVRAYHAGNMDAGIYISNVCFGQYSWMPAQFRSKQEGVAVLGEMAKAGHVHARYELANFYLLQILDAIGEGRNVPEEWYDRARRHAGAAAQMNYSGGHYLVGYMNHYGSGGDVDLPAAVIGYAQALEAAGEGYFELGIRADAAFNFGTMLFNGEGIARNRPRGVELVREAARLGNWMAKEWLEDNNDLIVQDNIGGWDREVLYDPSMIDAAAVLSGGGGGDDADTDTGEGDAGDDEGGYE